MTHILSVKATAPRSGANQHSELARRSDLTCSEVPRGASLALCVGIALLLCAAAADAQEVCKMEQLKDPKIPLTDIYGRAEAKAKAWKSDAVLARLTTMNMGPLDEQGRSEAWHVTFFSAAAGENVSISTFRGTLTCYASKGEAGRLPDIKSGFFRDGAKLYAIAKQHGADLLTSGHNVEIQTAAAPADRHATWYINFSKADGKSGGLMIVVNANTGEVEKVIK